MVLEYIPQYAGMIVEAGASANILLFCDGDLHVVQIIAVPDRLENRVGEAKKQDILGSFFAEVMIDAKNLAF